MRYTALLLVLLLAACTTRGPISYTYQIEDTESLEWSHGEQVSLIGTLWPSRDHTKFYINADDGRSANLRGEKIDKLKPGTKVLLSGRVEYVNSYGTAGASDVAHNQTYFIIDVQNFKVVSEAAWDIDYQNAVDPDKPDYSLR